jgi:hypothetical protein
MHEAKAECKAELPIIPRPERTLPHEHGAVAWTKGAAWPSRSMQAEPFARAAQGRRHFARCQLAGDFLPAARGFGVTAKGREIEPFMRLDEIERAIAAGSISEAALKQRGNWLAGSCGVVQHRHVCSPSSCLGRMLFRLRSDTENLSEIFEDPLKERA